MRPLLQTLYRLLSCRALAPLVLALFLLIYIAMAFVSDEALTMLMEMTRKNPPLLALLALLPLNGLLRLIGETSSFIRHRRLLAAGGSVDPLGAMFDEEVAMVSTVPTGLLHERLAVAGYTVRSANGCLAAWRGTSLVPLRLLCLAAMTLLFGGIVLSFVSRSSVRVPVIEGEQLEWPPGRGDLVERVTLREQSGALLERRLDIELTSLGGGRKTMGLYPPALYHGAYLYPRYLGIAPLIKFYADDLPEGVESHFLLGIYPPGKEDRAEIPATPYRLAVTLLPDPSGGDPFISGRMGFGVKILKGDVQLHSATVPLGGEVRGGGCRVVFAGFRRYVATDVVRDFGFVPIWISLLCYSLAAVCWLPLRLLSPRGEMVFLVDGEVTRAGSYAEGGKIRHGAVFHDALDLLAGEQRGDL